MNVLENVLKNRRSNQEQDMDDSIRVQAIQKQVMQYYCKLITFTYNSVCFH